LENYKDLWKILLNSVENKEELKDLILKKDFDENNFLHLLVSNDKPEIIEFTLNILKTNFNDEQFQDILHSKGELGRNLLHIAAKNAKNIKTHQILWKIIQEGKSDQEFLQFLKEVDSQKRNYFLIIACSSTFEIYELIIEKLKEVAGLDEVKNLMTSLDYRGENIIGIAVSNNKSLQFHEHFWKVIQSVVDTTEILNLINHCDDSGDNILHDAVYWNVKEIVDFTWNQNKTFIQIKEEQTEYLRKKGHRLHNLIQLSLENQSEDTEVHTWVENLIKEYEIVFDQDEDDYDDSDSS
jgi:hypothetical protein